MTCVILSHPVMAVNLIGHQSEWEPSSSPRKAARATRKPRVCGSVGGGGVYSAGKKQPARFLWAGYQMYCRKAHQWLSARVRSLSLSEPQCFGREWRSALWFSRKQAPGANVWDLREILYYIVLGVKAKAA